MTPLDILQNKFGYSAFRTNQEEIITRTLNKQDSFVLMPTGGGKSLCYQIPAMLQEGLTIVVSPLIALMKDQVDALRVNGIEAAYLNSTSTVEERAGIFHALEAGTLKLLYVAPERLFGGEEKFLTFIKKYNVSLFAVDEAHCISSWGHDFRPEYRELARLKKEFPGVPTIALTATADKITADDIVDKLALKDPHIFISSFNRENIHYYIEPKRNMYGRLLGYLQKHRDDAGIIYALSRQSTEDLAKDLTKDGFDALPYHAGLPQEKRNLHQNLFLKDEVKIIVATIAFGMGINKSNVRFVVHADLPKNIESYYQETGRAGRDGLKSEALLFYSGGDVMKLKHFATIDGNKEQSAIMLRKLSQMADLCETAVCRRQKVLAYFGELTEGNCASCDVCLSDYKQFDGTAIAKKALGAVAQFSGNYGLTYLVDFLRGSKSEKIKSWHKSLPSYGTGKDLSKDEWFSHLKNLIARGYLEQSGEYPVIKLNKKSEDVLAGKENVSLVEAGGKKEIAGDDSAVTSNVASIEDCEKELFDTLKAARMVIAAAEHVPAYIIFSDATLVELATYLPLTLDDIRKISGFGENKTARYGEQFLKMVQAYCKLYKVETRINQKTPKREKKVAVRATETVLKTLEMFKKGTDIRTIAKVRDLSPTTVENHLAQCVGLGQLAIADVVPVGKVHRIMEVLEKQSSGLIAPIKYALGDDVSYAEIKAVIEYKKLIGSAS